MKTSKIIKNNMNNKGFLSGIYEAFRDFFNNGNIEQYSDIQAELEMVKSNLSSRSKTLESMLEPNKTTKTKKCKKQFEQSKEYNEENKYCYKKTPKNSSHNKNDINHSIEIDELSK